MKKITAVVFALSALFAFSGGLVLAQTASPSPSPGDTTVLEDTGIDNDTGEGVDLTEDDTNDDNVPSAAPETGFGTL